MSDVWVIWSFEHDAWWRPWRWGYTRALADAGHYTKAEADQIVAQANIVELNEQALLLSEAQASGPPRRPRPVRTDDAIIQQLASEMRRKAKYHIELVLQPISLFQLVGALQLARRHPRFADQDTVADTVEQFIAAAREYFADCPTALDLMRRGDDPEEDR